MVKKFASKAEAARRSRRTGTYVEAFEQRERSWQTFAPFSSGFLRLHPESHGEETRSAQTALAEKSIRGCGSAAPNAGTRDGRSKKDGGMVITS